MKVIELVNDCAMIGIGFITIDTGWSSRSLIAFFWHKEEQQVWVDLLFINFKIRAQ